jgi:hypothetical protein
MRISVTVDDGLGGRLVQGAQAEGRSLANYTRLLLTRAAREDAVRAEQVPAGERQQPAAA